MRAAEVRRYVWTDDDVPFLRFSARNVANALQHDVKVNLQLAGDHDPLPGHDEASAAR